MKSNHLNPLVYDFFIQASKHLFNAAQSGDRELAEATLVNLQKVIPSYINALVEERNGSDGRQF